MNPFHLEPDECFELLPDPIIAKAENVILQNRRIRGYLLRRVLTEGVLFAQLTDALADFAKQRAEERKMLRRIHELACDTIVIRKKATTPATLTQE